MRRRFHGCELLDAQLPWCRGLQSALRVRYESGGLRVPQRLRRRQLLRTCLHAYCGSPKHFFCKHFPWCCVGVTGHMFRSTGQRGVVLRPHGGCERRGTAAVSRRAGRHVHGPMEYYSMSIVLCTIARAVGDVADRQCAGSYAGAGGSQHINERNIRCRSPARQRDAVCRPVLSRAQF